MTWPSRMIATRLTVTRSVSGSHSTATEPRSSRPCSEITFEAVRTVVSAKSPS